MLKLDGATSLVDAVRKTVEFKKNKTPKTELPVPRTTSPPKSMTQDKPVEEKNSYWVLYVNPAKQSFYVRDEGDGGLKQDQAEEKDRDL